MPFVSPTLFFFSSSFSTDIQKLFVCRQFLSCAMHVLVHIIMACVSLPTYAKRIKKEVGRRQRSARFFPCNCLGEGRGSCAAFFLCPCMANCRIPPMSAHRQTILGHERHEVTSVDCDQHEPAESPSPGACKQGRGMSPCVRHSSFSFLYRGGHP